MKKKPASTRRHFVKKTITLAAGWPLLNNLSAFANSNTATASNTATNGNATTDNTTANTVAKSLVPHPVPLQWLDVAAPAQAGATTWGTPWPQGAVDPNTNFSLQQVNGEALPLQSWPLAYWPDGTLKWTGHATAWQQPPQGALQLTTSGNAPEAKPLATETASSITVNTGLITAVINKKGTTLISTLSLGKQTIAEEGKLILLNSTDPDNQTGTTITQEFSGTIDAVTLEQNGPIRTVVKITGRHTPTPWKHTAEQHYNMPPRRTGEPHRPWLPFVIRFYFFQGSDSIRILHTITFDGNEQQDFISGLGIRFTVPLKDELHDRHIRFVGHDKGVFAEAVRGLTGLRRDPGKPFTDAQTKGLATPPNSEMPAAVAQRLQYIPAFGDYTLFQSSPNSFNIQKRTRQGYGWIQSAQGTRSDGMAFLGTPTGGIAIGIRNCWQSYPAQLDIRNAHTQYATLTAWLWAPKASPMDLRFYHDGMKQDTYKEQLEGLEITYEDYEPGFGTPVGVARTSELQLHVLAATPSNEQLANLAASLQQPPQLTCAPTRYAEAGVFALNWNQPANNEPRIQAIKQQLEDYFSQYQLEVDQRAWYGYWNYGDVMHSYDRDRHVWKYDVGGFAWDNSELSTDLWLWYYFLYTGKADVFRFAEAMTRHTGEVDVHHLGRFAPLGSRHNVLHWGCSAKQLRISTVANRRIYYYLTADERVGDLMREQVEAVRTLSNIVPGRKVGQVAATNAAQASVSFGTDWGAIAAAWLTEWERTNNPKVRDRLFNSMRTIAAQPHGFFTGTANMTLDTGTFDIVTNSRPHASHLSAVFGLAEICAELVALTDNPAFSQAWLQYCVLYNATPEEQRNALGTALSKLNLQQGHARLTAFAARHGHNDRLAARAWKEFFDGGAGIRRPDLVTQSLKGPQVLNPVKEAENVSTNAVAQWGLTALFLLGYIAPSLPVTTNK
ncbi:hypothetical protein [Paraflavitalea sp. CAU 1676]|uniref:exo-rhamnogalacturonan lyase family protein n=1 Tax=Paraflavitalea sp. CAU 1676 TaxID=3032598 RepID=UPI0023DC042E|nr:hypothetical protein [Paraflavitalea sp. CAU 1676]MDF2192377.1 hypothetical protein [Paraflavitalea sp. CAU 1676]